MAVQTWKDRSAPPGASELAPQSTQVEATYLEVVQSLAVVAAVAVVAVVAAVAVVAVVATAADTGLDRVELLPGCTRLPDTPPAPASGNSAPA